MASSSSFEDEDNARMITDINVTPLVDIVLVLLIIFMVTASFIVNPAIKVDLPKAASATEQARTSLALTIDRTGALFLNGEKSDADAVTRFIAAELPKDPNLQAIIAADRAVPHGSVVSVIDLVKRAGVLKFAIDVQAGQEAAAAPGQTGPESAGAPHSEGR